MVVPREVEIVNERNMILRKKVTKVHLNAEITGKGKSAVNRKSKKIPIIRIVERLSGSLPSILKERKIWNVNFKSVSSLIKSKNRWK
jgi:ribosomal protein L28